VANGYLGKVHLGLDYFDASINRVAAWVIGTRALRRALLWALLEPPAIRDAERVGDLTARLAWQEEMKALPFAAVWEQFCASQGVPADARWLDVVRRHERKVFNDR
jgi:L-rhamnose isomerase